MTYEMLDTGSIYWISIWNHGRFYSHPRSSIQDVSSINSTGILALLDGCANMSLEHTIA